MRILLVCRNISKNRWGGFEEHIYHLYNGLKNKYDIKILTTSIEEAPLEKFDNNVIVLNCLKMGGYALVDNSKINDVVKKFKPDVIHLQGWGSHLINYFLFNCKAFNSKGIKIFLTPHEFFHKTDFIKRFYNILLKRRLIRGANVVIALTGKQKKEISKFCKRVVLIPNGIDVEEFRKMEYKDEGFILMVGRLEKYKGFREVLKVGNEIGRKIVIVGRKGNEYYYLNRLIENLGINAEIHLNVERNKLLSFYERASVFVEASKREGFGITIIEALASGLPVVSRPVGIALNIPRKFISLYNSEKELKNTIMSMLNRKRYVFMKAREFVFENFSWKKIIKKYINLYERFGD
ncbi:MAG: glycosyltransferase family 4 protein [Candidatus Aenigmatarchaeota archaeon]